MKCGKGSFLYWVVFSFGGGAHAFVDEMHHSIQVFVRVATDVEVLVAALLQ
jgi:hypothetical protein